MASRLVIDSHGFGHVIHEDAFGDVIHTYGTIDPSTGKLLDGTMQNLNEDCNTAEDTSSNKFKAAPLNGPVSVNAT